MKNFFIGLLLLLLFGVDDSLSLQPVVVDSNTAKELSQKYVAAKNAEHVSSSVQEILVDKDSGCEQRVRQTLILNARAAIESYNAQYWKVRSEKLDKTQKDWTYNLDKGQFEPPKPK